MSRKVDRDNELQKWRWRYAQRKKEGNKRHSPLSRVSDDRTRHRPSYMALYVCESDLVKSHLATLGKVSCGKGCIRFKQLADLNLSAVESLLREILKLRKQGIGPSCR